MLICVNSSNMNNRRDEKGMDGFTALCPNHKDKIGHSLHYSQDATAIIAAHAPPSPRIDASDNLKEQEDVASTATPDSDEDKALKSRELKKPVNSKALLCLPASLIPCLGASH